MDREQCPGQCPGLCPEGSWQEKFALMMHDRILDIERELRALRPPPVDPRVRLLGAQAQSDTGAVFVRVTSSTPLDAGAWAAAVLRRMGETDDTRFDLWSCQHFGIVQDDKPYVTECLVTRSGDLPLAVGRVAHAALDAALECGKDEAQAWKAGVEAGAVVCPTWFAESIRTAAAEAARLWTWDPRARCCVSQGIGQTDETGARTPQELKCWTMLHGWLASQVERCDVWHPRALHSSKLAIELVSALAEELPG